MNDAERITRALGGDWRGHQGLAPCPLCQPEGRPDQRALSVSEQGGRLLFYCHKSGCDVWSAMRGEAPSWMRGVDLKLGLSSVDREERDRRRAEERKAEERRTEAATSIFEEAVCASGTLVQTYLAHRGIGRLRLDHMTRALRFHPALRHLPSGGVFPGMVARIREVGGFPTAIHRTYLRPDGLGKADVSPAKMMLGPSAGGAVRFGPNRPVIALAEGIETALSVSMASGLTCWATLSSSGLKGVLLPPRPIAEVVVICADNDSAGLSAAGVAAERFEREGRRVSIVHPDRPGADFNDELVGT